MTNYEKTHFDIHVYHLYNNIQTTHDKTNTIADAYIQDYDQPEFLFSLIRVSGGRLMGNSIMLVCP